MISVANRLSLAAASSVYSCHRGRWLKASTMTIILPPSTSPSRSRKTCVFLRSASSVEPSTRAINEKRSRTGAQRGCGTVGGTCACSRAQTSAKSWPITAAGSTASRLVMAWGLTCSGAIPNKPSRAKTFCTSAIDGTRRHTKLTMMATMTGSVRSRWRMRMSRCGCRGSRRSSCRGASNDGLSTSISRCSTSSTAGIGICERCRNSAWGRALVCLCAMGDLLGVGVPMIAQTTAYGLS